MNTERVRSGETVLTGEQAAEAMNVHFLRYDPEDMHDCDHCQHLVPDLGRGLVCRVNDVEVTYVHAVNDCKDWKSPYLSDYRRRPDLENELKK